MIFTRELGGFLRFADDGVSETPAARLHPATWWKVQGDSCPTLQFVAVSLLALPCSSAGSERDFKPLVCLLSRTRNRAVHGRVDSQWRVSVNTSQLRRPDVVLSDTRSPTEAELMRLVKDGRVRPPGGAVPTLSGAPAAIEAAGGGGPLADAGAPAVLGATAAGAVHAGGGGAPADWDALAVPGPPAAVGGGEQADIVVAAEAGAAAGPMMVSDSEAESQSSDDGADPEMDNEAISAFAESLFASHL